jgi:SAM-dependent methyltransferase
MKSVTAQWPHVNWAELMASLPRLEPADWPVLADYTRADVYRDIHGQGGLFLAADMADELELKPGMKVLDLACGAGTTSVFLAKRYGVQVYAVDKNELNAPKLQARAEEAGVGELVLLIKADARALPFAAGYFDAVFCLNSYFYFGTDDLYLPYLMKFVRMGGRICVGSPCYREELPPDPPEEWLVEFPDCLAVHSPAWWRRHFEKIRIVRVMKSICHPRSRIFWEDWLRHWLETKAPADMSPPERDGLRAFLRMLENDPENFVTHLLLVAEKIAPAANSPGQYYSA